MHITFAPPDSTQGFRIERRDDLVLIRPDKSKTSWRADERWFRSLIVNDSGQVQSVGFPKFMNWDEDPDDTACLREALEQGTPVEITDKIDGSLCIRSVIAGAVVLRTRGTFDGGHMQTALWQVAQRYPRLLDPSYRPDQSLLFEFISPDYRVILEYPDAELIALGGVDHASLHVFNHAEARQISDETGAPLVSRIELPTEPAALVAAVQQMDATEGVVARAGDTLVKVKALRYLELHRLRFSLTPRRVAAYVLEHDIRDADDYRRALAEQGLDWELAETTLPVFLRVRDAIDQAAADIHAACAFAQRYTGLERKQYAERALEDRTVSDLRFAARDQRLAVAAERHRERLLEQAVKSVDTGVLDNTEQSPAFELA